MVGLLAAVGVAMSALVGLAHGELTWVALADAAAATGLAAYLALPLPKKNTPNLFHYSTNCLFYYGTPTT